jgi:hypothetical protein
MLRAERRAPGDRAARCATAGALGLIALTVLLGVTGCRRAATPKSRASDSTTASNLASLPAPPRTLSRFDVPLAYDFSPILPVVEHAVPRTFGSLDSVHVVGTDERKHYAFVATRNAFTMFAHGPNVHLRTTLSYQARGFYKPVIGPTIGAGCGDAKSQPKIVIDLVTPLTLSPAWHLQSAARLAHLGPASDSSSDRCQVSILSFDVTDKVVEAAREALTSHMAEIDRKISDIDLTDRAKGWWELLNRPIGITNDVWLVLQPQRIRLSKVTGEGHTLTVRAGLDAYPAVVTGPEPHPPLTPLPPLAKDTVTNKFEISLEGDVDYLTASHAITEAIGGKPMKLGSRSVTVKSVIASPDAAGRLALAVGFTGDASGTIRLVGTPRYERHLGKIDVPDLDYDLKTDNDLINAFAWLRSNALLSVFRSKAQIPVAPVLERAKGMLLSGLNRTIGDVMTLSASVDSVSVRGLYVTPAGLTVRAGASGEARVSIHQEQ